MIPVDQTIFGFGDEQSPEVGNCFQACVASLFELALDDVPHFCAHEDWLARLEAWAAERGYWPMLLRLPTDHSWSPAVPYILSGQSPRRPDEPDKLHAVVACGDVVLHDPHPSRDGVQTHFDATLFVPLDLAAHHRSLS